MSGNRNEETQQQQNFTWDDIALRYTDKIQDLVRRRAKAPHIRAYHDDIVQQVLIRLNDMLVRGGLNTRLEELDAIVVEVVKSKINHQYEKLKRQSRLGKTSDDGSVDWADRPVHQPVEDEIEVEDSAALLAKVSQGLPEMYREVIHLRAEGHTMEAIATILGAIALFAFVVKLFSWMKKPAEKFDV